MNGGTKIILLMGIAAAVIFTANFLAGIHAHRQITEHHRACFESVRKTALAGSEWNGVKKNLTEKGCTLDEVALKNGSLSVMCRWPGPENKAHVQTERLNVPVSAVIQVGPDGKIISVSGGK